MRWRAVKLSLRYKSSVHQVFSLLVVVDAQRPRRFMGELTPQIGISNCKTWYENEFQVSYETWPQTRSFSYQVLQSSLLENSEIPTCG